MNNTNPSLVLKQPRHCSFHSTLSFKQPKMKPIFRNKVKWRCLINSDITYVNKYRPKMVSTVELKSLQYPQFKSIRNLCRALTDTKRISSLTITDSCDFYQDFDSLAHLLKATNRWKNLILYLVDAEDDNEDRLNPEKLKRLVRFRRCQDLSSLAITLNCYYKTTKNILKHLSQQVQGLPNLKTLGIDVSYQWLEEDDDSDTNSSLLTFKYPRSLSCLRLNFHEAESNNTQLLPRFASNIRRCRLLDHLSLDFKKMTDNIDPSEAQILASLAEKTSSLKTLHLYKVLHFHELEANKTYLQSYQHLKTLTTLNITLYLSFSEKENQILAPIFFTHLTSLTNLKSLYLALSFWNDNPVLQNIFPSLRTFSKLEHLCLDLARYSNIDNQFLHNLALPCLCNLNHFELILPNSNITHEGLTALFSSFKQLPQLKSLCLNFKKIKANYKIIEILSSMISHLGLTSLEIILGDQLESPKSLAQKLVTVWKSEQRLIPLFSALCSLNFLENLSLNFSKFEVSTKEFKKFSFGLKELKQLKSLSLELPQFDFGNNFEGLRRFLSGLKELQKLNLLHLNFKGAGLWSEEVELIALNLRDCSRYLEDLHLNFEDAKKLGNEALESLGLGLENLLSLKSLSLIIGDQKAFEKEAIFKLMKRLTILKDLESLILTLEFSTHYAEIKKIKKSLINHQNFKNLTKFSFNDHTWI